MRSNVEKVLERDSKLSDLDRRADDLSAASVQFHQSSNRLRKKMWWENLKMKLIVGAFLLALFIVVVTVIAMQFGGEGEEDKAVEGAEGGNVVVPAE